jgi:hypothetical protein
VLGGTARANGTPSDYTRVPGRGRALVAASMVNAGRTEMGGEVSDEKEAFLAR